MRTNQAIAVYQRLRSQSAWRLVAADHAPAVIAMLESHLYGDERTLPASILYERIERDLESLRAQGHNLSSPAQIYVAEWLRDGFLERRLPVGASEEEYELSTAAVDAIRFASGLAQPHSAATESRLALVIKALISLSEETETDVERRIDSLMAERSRIDLQIEALYSKGLAVLSDETALERTREIIALASDLSGDFRRVRDQFEELNRELREKLLDNEERRGAVLQQLFAGVDLILESDAGRTFSAFWRLLTDMEQSALLDAAVQNLLSRAFVADLPVQGKRFLRGMTGHLMAQAGVVQETMHTFARSLKNFVQSREYLQQRQLQAMLKTARRQALTLRDDVKSTAMLEFILDLTSSKVESYSQWELHDPSLQSSTGPMFEGEASAIDLERIGELVAESEIDFRALQANVIAVLEKFSQATVGMVLEEFPAEQGLGSVVGLLSLASRHGWLGQSSEIVHWAGLDGQQRRAQIPSMYFVRERAHELA